ncbi:hypothetical protein OIU74_011007 [Salix koriyanagi]|uniref:Uncharacterized protein n=1 Tax=Salix koriyanagi TaxID=2511006 RepID=A0A9Q0TE74_9ROSI|nr:hypothetical protein OIU74_011007 [Salix koriyanagi]
MMVTADAFPSPFQNRVLEAVTGKMRCWQLQRCSMTYIFDAAYVLLKCCVMYLCREVGIHLRISQEIIRCFFTILQPRVPQLVADLSLGRLANWKLSGARLTMNRLP